MADPFDSNQPGLTSPASDGFAITPSDSTVLTTTRGIYVGTGGTLVVRTKAGTQLTFTNVGSGVILPFRCDKVLATGTTASGLIGLV